MTTPTASANAGRIADAKLDGVLAHGRSGSIMNPHDKVAVVTGSGD